jgi:hypothetical protein
MKRTYKAVEVAEPGVLRVVERAISEPGAGQVRIRVEAYGICHTDEYRDEDRQEAALGRKEERLRGRAGRFGDVTRSLRKPYDWIAL